MQSGYNPMPHPEALSTGDSKTAVEREPAVLHEMSLLCTAVDVLESRYTEMESKLKPVLASAIPPPASPDEVENITCELSDSIAVLRKRLYATTESFLRLRNRIEL